MMKKPLSITAVIAALILTSQLFAQQTYVNKKWEDTSGNVGPISRTVSTVDNNKNAIVVSNKLNSQNNTDVIITKYDPDGVLLWTQIFDAAGGDDYGVQVEVTSNGHIYIAAVFQTATVYDFGILKYYPNGTLAWVNSWNGPASGLDVPADIEIDGTGNVYLVGGTQSSNSTSDYAIVKFDANGAFLWDKTYDHAQLHDAATSLKIDNDFIVVTGASASAPTNWDYATLKLAINNGNTLAVERTEVTGVGLDNALAVTMDADNNVYITGYVEISGNRNIQTVKINEIFGLEWVKNFDGGLEDVAKAIRVDNFGNVYIAGHTTKPNGGRDFITIKYDSDGVEQWKREFGSQGGELMAEANQLDLNEAGEPIITGSREKDGQKDFATIKYDSNGDLKFVKEFDAGSGDDIAESIVVKDGDVIVSGTSEVNGVKQSTTIKYEMVERDKPIALDPDGYEYVEGQLIVRFDRSAINYSAIYDKEKTAGPLGDFVHPSVWSEMSQKLGHSCKDLRTYKIFMGMTPADSISISRLGHEVRVDDAWATLTVDFDTPISDQDVIDSLSTMFPIIHYVERNQLLELTSIPNDLYVQSQQASLIPTASYPDGGINVEEAWDVSVGEEHTRVGVFDSPIYWAHEDFGDGTFSGSKIAGGWDFTTEATISSVTNPDVSHGTSCAGIIGALRNNGTGIAGIAGGDVDGSGNTGVSLYSLGIAEDGTFETAAAAIQGAAFCNSNSDYGFCLDVQNHSYVFHSPSQTLNDAITSAWQNHSIVVAARGNFGDTNLKYPACSGDDQVISVGYGNYQGEYYQGNGVLGNEYSTGGQGGNHGGGMDLIAPGVVETVSSLINPSHPISGGSFPSSFGSGGAYQQFNGSSAAAPHVSGVVALMHSHHHENNGAPNNLATEDAERILQKTATDVINVDLGYPAGYDSKNGWGMLDASAALNEVNYPSRYIKHFDNNNNGTISATSNVPLILAEPWSNSFSSLAAGSYTANRYLVSWDVSVTLPENELILDWWPLRANCRGVSGATVNDGSEYLFTENTSVTDHTLSTTIKTFAYHVHTVNGSGQTVNVWLPTHPSYLDASISVHIDDLLVSSLDESLLLEGFNVYPNPVSDLLNVSFESSSQDNINIRIFDAIGKKTMEFSNEDIEVGSNTLTIDMSRLPRGTYLISLNSDSFVHSQRFVKQ